MQYKALVFDFFGVLSSEVAPAWFQDHVAGTDLGALKDSYVSPADKGMVSAEKLFDQLSGLSGVPAAKIPEQWLGLVRINAELLSFIRESLAGKYKLGILTNVVSAFFREALLRHPLINAFDAIVVSSEIGHAKPEPEAYTAILKALAVKPHEALMIDDNPENVAGAKAAGMGGILFTSTEQLRRDLRRNSAPGQLSLTP
ncbi:MAG: hypothetical protein A3B23_03800 [Candidatus Colwellbacteria bacterium RIFCSPLOWO2_01_FULL_48_10]|uniref:Haloacid dehalogenase n=1 Tax=Candidatus Colwellbacteria bacterium RIFCSPLOWO2_01_FULL_48_10 TaxID=1797690 RepID=A0A1G1Z5S8_9BACT|nr:MAG: hypothetical protein A3B23_03800 [Candidatus Colwellbacteria bacterium RIFCSPLOWO2_01_FULL_48_10]